MDPMSVSAVVRRELSTFALVLFGILLAVAL